MAEETTQDGVDITSADLHDDNGMASRKFGMSLLAMGLIFGAGVLSTWVHGLAENLGTVVGGILGALGIFAGANVSTKWAAASLAKAKLPPPKA